MHYTHKKKLAPGGLNFRLIRVLTVEDNVHRLRKHVAKLTRRMRNVPFMRKIRLRNARRARSTP